jgi:hypothetical protein
MVRTRTTYRPKAEESGIYVSAYKEYKKVYSELEDAYRALQQP